MLASPEVTCCCAHEKSRKGTTQNETASTVMWAHSLRLRGSVSCRSATNSPSVRAPRMSRDHATCAGESPPRATFMNRKLEPQMMPVSTNWIAIELCEGARLAAVDATAAREESVAGGGVGTRRL